MQLMGAHYIPAFSPFSIMAVFNWRFHTNCLPFSLFSSNNEPADPSLCHSFRSTDTTPSGRRNLQNVNTPSSILPPRPGLGSTPTAPSPSNIPLPTTPQAGLGAAAFPQPTQTQIIAAGNAVNATTSTRNLPPGTPAHGRDILIQFIAITNHMVAPILALNYVMRHNWDLNAALNAYMRRQAGEPSEDGESEDEKDIADLEDGEDEGNMTDDAPDVKYPVNENGQRETKMPVKPTPSKAKKVGSCFEPVRSFS